MSMLMFLLVGCDTSIKTAEPVLESVESFQELGIQVFPTISHDGLKVRAAFVNSIGTGIPGGDISFSIDAPDGTEQTEIVSSDAFGFATATFDVPEGQYTVRASSGSFTEEGLSLYIPEVKGFPSSMGSMSIAPDGFTDNAVPATGGSYLVSSTNIIFYPNSIGTLGFEVASFPVQIMGAWSAHIDGDGILDLVCWSATEAYILRGHPEGGLTYISGYRIPDHSIVSVMANDLDLDRNTDIMIAGTTDELSVITMLKGTGSWEFEEQTPLKLIYPIDTMSASDEASDGRFEVSVISALDGIIRRHSLTQSIWLGGSPSVINPEAFTALPGSILPPPKDIDADGRVDLIVVGGQGASSQSMVFFIINSSVTKYDQTYGSYFADFYDVDNNGSTDILSMEEDILHMVSYQPDSQTYTAKSFSDLGPAGPIVSSDHDSDGLAEVTVFNPHPLRHSGYKTELSSWSVYTPTWRRSETSFSAKHIVWDINDDGINEVIGFIRQNDSTRLRTMPLGVYDNDTTDDTLDDILELDGTAYSSLDLGNVIALDLIGCGDNIYALSDDAIEIKLHQFTIENDSFIQVENVSTDGSKLACAFNAGDPSILVHGTDTFYEYSDTLQLNGTGDSTGWFDAAIGNFDGSGLGVRGCDVEGCQIEAVDLNGDGIDERALGSEDGIVILSDEEQYPLEIAGEMAIRDIDLDGINELVVRGEQTGLYWVYRGISNGIAPPYSINLFTESILMPYFADVDDDGIAEAFTDDSDLKFAAMPLSSTLQ
jgi:hypothetical protein